MIFFESKNCEGSDPPVFDLESVTSGEAATSPEVRRFLRVFRAATRITLKIFSKDSVVCVGQRPHHHCSPKNCPMPKASSNLVSLKRHKHTPVMCTHAHKPPHAPTPTPAQTQTQPARTRAPTPAPTNQSRTHRTGCRPRWPCWRRGRRSRPWPRGTPPGPTEMCVV